MSYHILVASYPNDNGERHKLSDMTINRLGSPDVKKTFILLQFKKRALSIKSIIQLIQQLFFD